MAALQHLLWERDRPRHNFSVVLPKKLYQQGKTALPSHLPGPCWLVFVTLAAYPVVTVPLSTISSHPAEVLSGLPAFVLAPSACT